MSNDPTVPDPAAPAVPADRAAAPETTAQAPQTPEQIRAAKERAILAATAAPQTAPVYRTALRHTLLLSAVLVVVGGGIGLAVSGTPGLWGALIGAGLALLFSGATPLSMLVTAGSTIQRMTAVVMGTWLVKVIVVIGVLVVLRGLDFYDSTVFGIVLLAGVAASAFLDYRAVVGTRVPYISPVPPNSEQM
ncbi:hypothetical protein [Cellulomonas sp. NPDC089187]|uniref:hypothetical protein n=1 Tax=Cellulomonas sp. NPDC089187 TaxID=3154970 RepID=UPI00341B0922